MDKQVTRNKSQAGFSLIELLVVVAIIGVLAAAGIVGYSRYLDGVKKDTNINNAKAIATALALEFTTKAGNLGGGQCNAVVDAEGSTAASDPTSNTKLCVQKLIDNGKFKDSYTSGKALAATVDTTCGDSTANLLVTYSATLDQTKITSCIKGDDSGSGTITKGPEIVVSGVNAWKS